jgi:hypothetical protein
MPLTTGKVSMRWMQIGRERRQPWRRQIPTRLLRSPIWLSTSELSRHFETEKDAWQNWTAGDYVESIAAWLETTPTFPEHHAEREAKLGGDRPTWREVALLFEMGRIYE